MKEEKKTSMSEERVVDLLTPRHTPECKASFRAPQAPRRINPWYYIRTAGMAAVLMIGIFVGIKVLAPGKAYAAMTPQLVIDKAREKLRDVRSFRMVFQVHAQEYKEMGELDFEASYDLLRTDRGYFIRSECMLPVGIKIVLIYTPDSIKIWHDDELQLAAPYNGVGKNLSLTLDAMLDNIENDKDNLTIKEYGDEIILCSEAQAYTHQDRYEMVFSKTDGLIKSANGIITKDDGPTIFIKSKRIDYNIPLTAEKIQRTP